MFRDREEAGEALAAALKGFERLDPVVYALPRGGVPVAAKVASKLGAPLDLILVRKLGAPSHSELAIGALVDGAAPTTILHDDVIRALRVPSDYIEAAKAAALVETERRRALFSAGRKPLSPKGRNVIIIDDGLATGATMEAAVAAVRKAGAKRVVVAVPVAPAEAAIKFHALADDFVCIETPPTFWAVGAHYRNFPQLEDKDVLDILSGFDAGVRGPPFVA
ncbi:MAG: phosphoribosyltransferase family protein [Parvularculaceae bacterium]